MKITTLVSSGRGTAFQTEVFLTVFEVFGLLKAQFKARKLLILIMSTKSRSQITKRQQNKIEKSNHKKAAECKERIKTESGFKYAYSVRLLSRFLCNGT